MMKKLLGFLLALLVALPVFAANVKHSGVTIGDLKYNLYDDNTAEVAQSTVSEDDTKVSTYTNKEYIIPPTVSYDGKNYTVTQIAKEAFYGSTTRLVVIQAPIVHIGRDAFAYCRNIKPLLIPETVRSIDKTYYSREFEGGGVIAIFLSNNTYDLKFEIIPYYKADDLYGTSTLNYMGKNTVVDWNDATDAMQLVRKLFDVSLDVTGDLQSGVGDYQTKGRLTMTLKNRPDVQLGCNVNLNYKINKAPLTVVVDNVSREYGEPNPAFSNQFTISGFVGGEDKSVIDVMPALGCDATQRSDAGEYPIKCSGGTAKNYEFVANTTGTLTVTKAPLEATVADSERTYGEENPAFMLHDYVGLRNGDTDPGFESAPEFSTVADKESPVGSYDVSATGGSMKNYAFASLKPGTLTVNPATLTVTADNASRLYREENPALTFTVEGWRNGQDNSAFTQAPELSTTATLTSDAGEYPITIAKTAVAHNYAISYVDGTLTVDKRELTVSADDCQRPYGEENPEFAISYQGFAGDDDASVLSEAPVATTTATAKSDVGTYPIEISGGEAKNYNVTYNPGTLTIVKAEQEIMWEQDLSNLVQDDLVLLTAVATSGLPITYTVTDNNVCDIFVRGDEQYLDCIGVGETRVRANQAGNNNYEPAFREVKHVMIAAVPDKPVLTIRSLPMGEASFAVDKGTTLKIKLAAQSGWKINSVTVDDEDYTAELSQSRNVLTTPAINADMQVVITYEESAVTDRADLMSDRGDIRVLGRGDGIRVTGAPEGETVSIYNVDGMLIKSERIASSTAHDISLQTGEIYIVAIASRTFKLRI